MQLKAQPMLAPRPGIPMQIAYIGVVFTLPAMLYSPCVYKQVPGFTVVCCYLLLCSPTGAPIVVSQDVYLVSVAVVLET